MFEGFDKRGATAAAISCIQGPPQGGEGGILVDTLVLSPDDTKCRSATVYAEAKFTLLSDGQPPSS